MKIRESIHGVVLDHMIKEFGMEVGTDSYS